MLDNIVLCISTTHSALFCSYCHSEHVIRLDIIMVAAILLQNRQL